SLLDLLYVKLLAEWAEVESIAWNQESKTFKISTPHREWEFSISSDQETLLRQIMRHLENLLERKNYSALSASLSQCLQRGNF
ncbi:MAG: hypothetical protein ACK4G3_06745, partial [bacterium]